MKVKTISYAKVFPLAAYVNERIGVEVELDETDGYEETFQQAKQLVEKFHKDNNPQLVGEDGFYKAPISSSEMESSANRIIYHSASAPIPSIDYRAKEKLEIDIDNATTKADLEFYVDAAEKYGLMELWNEKNNSLAFTP